MFTAGIHTTSRIESINAIVKQYVNGSAEISDIFNFLCAFENNIEQKYLKEKEEQDLKKQEVHPLLSELHSKLSKYLYELHFEQQQLSSRYFVDPADMEVRNLEKKVPVFNVKSIDAPTKFRQVFSYENKYECNCETFVRCGVICRHVFYVVCMKQEKQLKSSQINQRWLQNGELKSQSLKALFSEIFKEENNIKLNIQEEEEKIEIMDVNNIIKKENNQVILIESSKTSTPNKITSTLFFYNVLL